MANFTDAQAAACTISECCKCYSDDVFITRTITVIDADGNGYVWDDPTIAEGATDRTVKEAIHTMLMTIEKRPTPPSNSEESQGIDGERVG